jgi:ABC-type amino acid transport substrate-binding protein
MASLGIVAFVACVFAAQAQQAPDPRVADIIRSGKLRVALGLGSPVLAIKDSKSGEVRGPALDGSDLRLTKMLKHAELVRAETVAAIIEMVRAGQVDAYAGPRVVPKGNAGRIAYVSDFIEEAKSSGLVQRAIDQYALTGIQVAGAKVSGAR